MLKIKQKDPMTISDLAIQLIEVPGLWVKFSGIKWTVNRGEYADPESGVILEASSGNVKHDAITISRPYDPDSPDDIAAIDYFEQKKCGKEKSTINLRPVYRCNGTQYRGKYIWVLNGCRIKSFSVFNNMDVGATSQNPVELMAEFSYENYTRQ